MLGRFPRCIVAALLALVVLAIPSRGQGDPTRPPSGLTIVFVDVGQGDGTVIVGPGGTTLVFDGGPDGAGNLAMVPVLKRLGVKSVKYVVASHYHSDHVGGLDEVMKSIAVAEVWDRGNSNPLNTNAYRDYVKEAGQRRNTLKVGQVFALGSGAKATVLASDGHVIGGRKYDLNGWKQTENGASVVLKVEYGNFSMWLGGDLTGGGNGTFDMESKVCPACGDVDVYQVDHHGSNTSTNANLVAALRPEVAIASCGYKNPYGHPTATTINRLNTKTASSLCLSTSAGTGIIGFTVMSTTTLTTDGWRYRVEDVHGRGLDLYTDEVTSQAPGPGALLFSEVHRRPTASAGAYLEVQAAGASPINLRGLSVSGNLGSFTVAAPYRLLPGERLLFVEHGDAATNGGLPFGHTWPFKAFRLGTVYDTLALGHATQRVDTLSYTSGFAGGSGVAAERIDFEVATAASGFRAAIVRYGRGDRGSPAGKNSVDATRYRMRAGLEVLSASAPGGAALNLVATGLGDTQKWDWMALAYGTFPGIFVSGTYIPLNPDNLFAFTIGLPGFLAVMPSSGRRGIRLPVPDVPGLRGKRGYFAHFLIDPFGPRPIPSSSLASTFIFP